MFIRVLKNMILLTMLIASCDNLPKGVDRALDLSGNNRKELEKVIDHYSKNECDSLKLRAAYYLIEHMVFNGSCYKVLLDQKGDISDFDARNCKNRWSAKKYLDTLWQVGYSLKTIKESDLRTLKSEYLIDNIEQAFEVWPRPWNRNVDFEMFCKYILPYRVENEPITNIRKKLKERYLALLNSVKGLDSPIAAATIINRFLRQRMSFNSLSMENPYMQLIESIDSTCSGLCDDLARYGVYIMRSVGIPAVTDFTIWGSSNLGHKWCTVLGENSKKYSFLPGESTIKDGFKHMQNKGLIFTKIYRNNFNCKVQNDNYCENYKSFMLNNRHIEDVTTDYIKTYCFKVEGRDTSKEAFLCVYKKNSMFPISYARKNNEGDFRFQNIGGGILYYPCYYINGEFEMFDGPYILHKNGEKERIVSETKVYTKYVYPCYIKRGEIIAIYMWDVKKKDWVFLQKKKCLTWDEEFNNIPEGVLLRVNENRPFIIKEGKITYY